MSRGRKLERKLDIVWHNSGTARYIPKASPGRPPGGFAWDVFDQRDRRFLSAEEVLRLSDDELRQTMPVN